MESRSGSFHTYQKKPPSHPGRNDGRMLVQPGMVAHLLQDRQDFQILEESLGDLSCFRISGEIVEGERLPLAGYWKISVEIGPIDLVAQLHPSQHDSFQA